MGIPNESVTENEIAEEKRQQAEATRRPRLEKSLEQGLAELEKDLVTIPASDPPNVTQPSAIDQTKK